MNSIPIGLVNHENLPADLVAQIEGQLKAISIEWCYPLEKAAEQLRRTTVTGDSESSRQTRFGLALDLAIVERMSSPKGKATKSSLAAFSVSMGIRMAEWCPSCLREYEPDIVFVENTDSTKMPYATLGSVSLIEVVWKNRQFLDAPAVFDPGIVFGKLQSYVMVDYLRPRMVLYRYANNWRFEVFEGDRMPKKIEGLDFEVDWVQLYSEAGVLVRRPGFFRSLLDVFKR